MCEVCLADGVSIYDAHIHMYMYMFGVYMYSISFMLAHSKRHTISDSVPITFPNTNAYSISTTQLVLLQRQVLLGLLLFLFFN